MAEISESCIKLFSHLLQQLVNVSRILLTVDVTTEQYRVLARKKIVCMVPVACVV